MRKLCSFTASTILFLGCGGKAIVDPPRDDPAGAGGDGGSTPTVVCGNARAVHDDFTAPDPFFWLGLSESQSVAGQLSIPVEPDDTTRVQARWSVTLDAAGAVVKLAARGSQADASFSLQTSGGDGVEIFTAVDELVTSVIKSGTSTAITAVPFEEEQQRWWWIRREGDHVIWSASPNGADWVELHDTVYDVPSEGLFVTFEARPRFAGQGMGFVRFDDLNTVSAPWCPAHQLSDTFVELDPARWRQQQTSAGVEFGAAGFRVIFSGAVGNARGSLTTRTAFDLRGSSVSIAAPVVADNGEASLRIGDTQGTKLGLSRTMTTMSVQHEASPFAVELDPDAAWWRIRERNGLVIYEVAGKSGDWKELWSGPTAVDLSAVEVVLEGKTDQVEKGGEIVFPSYNLAPP
ncbi:MAG: hypothetical protein R3B72_42875 [Polyangiaceae bacterium]